MDLTIPGSFSDQPPKLGTRLVEPFAIIPVGYPMGNDDPLTRRPLEEIVRYDRW